MSQQYGVCDEIITDESYTDFTTNKLGGEIKHLPEKYFKVEPCQVCGQDLKLVCQIYCPLTESVFHRVLYVFACVHKSCWNKSESWTVYRSQLRDLSYMAELSSPTTDQTVNVTNLTSTNDWTIDSEDWDNSQNDDGILDLESQIMNLSFQDKKQMLDDNNNNSSSFISFYNDAPSQVVPANLFMNEANKFFQGYYLSVQDMEFYQTKLIRDKKKAEEEEAFLDSIESNSNESVGYQNEEYEKPNLKHGDVIFYDFRNAIDDCPHQCIRYSKGGSPLFIQKATNFEPSELKCQHCKSPCAYELQLMPALVNFLHPYDNSQERCSLEFGVSIVYTCTANCWDEGDLYRKEHIFVQSDPDDILFK